MAALTAVGSLARDPATYAKRPSTPRAHDAEPGCPVKSRVKSSQTTVRSVSSPCASYGIVSTT
eukprot:4544459-Prymnesium_polylepis.1